MFRHANSKSGHKFNSALATWKKLKSTKPAHTYKTQVNDEDSEPVIPQRSHSERYVIENGPQGELFIFYLKEKVLEMWDWTAPTLKSERDTLYLQTRLQARETFNLKSFKVIKCQDGEYIAVAVTSEDNADNVDVLRISSTFFKVASRIVLPFGSEKYSIKANDSFVCIGTDRGAVHIYRFGRTGLVLENANTDSALSNIKRNCCNIPGGDDIRDFGDDNLIIKTSCSDSMAIFDIIQGWFVYCPTKSEYTYLKNMKSNNKNCRNVLLVDETVVSQDPIITNFMSPSAKKRKTSLFTPVKLSGSTPLYNKLVSSLSKTTLDGIFKVSELSSAKYKEYMESKLELNNIGKSIGKSLYTNIQKGSEFLKPNDNQILTIVDLYNDRSLATFKPLGGVSQVSFSQYDLQLATANLRGDLLYIWDLYRLPTEISLVGKFTRGNTSAIVQNIFWFNAEDDNRDTHSGFGCISKATGSVHWYNMNNMLGEGKVSERGIKIKRSRRVRSELQKNDWTLSAFEGDKFLNVLDGQIGVLTRAGSLKMINPTNGHHYYEYRIPREPIAEFSNSDSFTLKELKGLARLRNPLAQAEIETCAPYLNLINHRNVELGTYLYESVAFDDFGNDIEVDCLNVRSIPTTPENVCEKSIDEVISEASALNKIYIDQGDEEDD